MTSATIVVTQSIEECIDSQQKSLYCNDEQDPGVTLAMKAINK